LIKKRELEKVISSDICLGAHSLIFSKGTKKCDTTLVGTTLSITANAREYWNFILKEGKGHKDLPNRKGMKSNNTKCLVILRESLVISISAKRWEIISEKWLGRMKTILINQRITG